MEPEGQGGIALMENSSGSRRDELRAPRARIGLPASNTVKRTDFLTGRASKILTETGIEQEVQTSVIVWKVLLKLADSVLHNK